MQNDPAQFRDRLLGAQQMTPALRDEYRKELDAILNHTLTPRTRALAWAGIITAIAFAALLIRGLILSQGKPSVILIFLGYLAAAGGTVVWLGHVLRQGGFARRTSYAVIEGLGSIFAGVYVTGALLRGIHAPSDPANLMAAIWAVMLLMIGFAWGTGNRIAAASLETRAHLLRIESRLADLAERIAK